MKGLNIVIIEDERSHFDLMKRTLRTYFQDISVYHFEEAGAFLESFDEIKPDIIITDFIMPDMDGIELLEILNNDGSDIPVIMMTGQGDETVAVRAMKLGVKDYLVKSDNFFNLLPSIVEKAAIEQNFTKKLQKSEKRFIDLAASTSGWIWELDKLGRYIYSSQGVEKIIGYRINEVVGRNFYDFFPDNERETLKEASFKMMAEKTIISDLESHFIHKDGHEVVVDIRGIPFFDDAGRWLGYRGVNHDISARKFAEMALQESEEKFKTIFEESPIGIMLFDAQGRLVGANHSYLDIFGISDLSMIKDMNLFDSPNFSDEAMAELHKNGVLRREILYDFKQLRKGKHFKRKKSGHIYVDTLLTLLGDKGEYSFKGYMVQIQDITKRKCAEASMRKLSQKLISAQEEERQRISSDLHDNLAQDLLTLKIGLETLFYDWPDAPDILLQKASDLSGMVNKAITQIREIAYGLRPPGLDQLGLAQTIRQYCDEFCKKNRIKVDFFSAGMEGLDIDLGIKISLYRFAKEVLNNIKKHADANHVKVRLVASYPNIILRIKDNGKGFNVRERLVEARNEKRIGIWSMEERVGFLNGRMDVESKPCQGTQIVIEIPLEEHGNG
ncbi:MAG: PAS domain S-box protein [Desulfosarcina sp.]|nr:PAS domain S-box protein [Desulfobacterales bacterium]